MNCIMNVLALVKDANVILFSTSTIILAFFCFYYLSGFVGSLILLSLISGLFLPFLLFSDRWYVPNLLALFTGPSQTRNHGELPRSCSICGGEQCNRQHSSVLLNTTAHSHIHFMVPRSVDEALEELFNLVLDNHVYSWYKEISVDDQLADEIRYLIRYAAASLGTRLCKVDLTSVILNRLIPLGVSHLDAYVEGSQRVRGKTSVQTSVIQYLRAGNGLHQALESREEEANYLRGIVAALCPYLIPVKYQESNLAKIFLQELLGRFLMLQGMDLLADPDTINFLFLLLFTSFDDSPWPPAPEEPKVIILKSFSSVNTHPRNSVFRSNLSSVLKDQNLLYLFHSYLKEEGAINILSFCLAVEDFNHHILDPDLTPEQLKQLHKEALELYHTYMVRSAVDRLDFQLDIVMQIREIVHGDICEIVKLRTTRPLFQAYEYAYNLLEREYLPLFMNSITYFSHLCGSKNSPPYYKNCNRENGIHSPTLQRNKVGKVMVQRVGSGLACIGRQMALKPAVINGDEDVLMDMHIDEASDISSYLMGEEYISSTCGRSALEGLTPAFRDLSAWRVAIPRVETRVDSAGKMDFVFIVDVTRIDMSGDNPEEMHWEVERRFHEFYILEAKLTEFHGEFSDNILPPKRSLFASKGNNFMHSRRQIFEEYLQKLLQKPSLKGSQLLFLFFKTKDEFTPSYLPDVSIGRLLKEVPRKLIKERGQNLDAFVSSFISATSYINNTLNIYEFDENNSSDETCPSLLKPEDIKLLGDMYSDNASNLPCSSQLCCPPPASPFMHINGVFDMVLFIGVRIYGLSQKCIRWAICLRVLIGTTIDSGIAWFLKRKLNEALAAPRIVKLIHLIRDALFFDPPSPRSKLDRTKREREIRHAVIDLIPKLLQKLLFVPDLYCEGANTLVNLFQHPILNKQLSYTLLDVVLEELFPEILQEDEHTKISSGFSSAMK